VDDNDSTAIISPQSFAEITGIDLAQKDFITGKLSSRKLADIERALTSGLSKVLELHDRDVAVHNGIPLLILNKKIVLSWFQPTWTHRPPHPTTNGVRTGPRSPWEPSRATSHKLWLANNASPQDCLVALMNVKHNESSFAFLREELWQNTSDPMRWLFTQ